MPIQYGFASESPFSIATWLTVNWTPDFRPLQQYHWVDIDENTNSSYVGGKVMGGFTTDVALFILPMTKASSASRAASLGSESIAAEVGARSKATNGVDDLIRAGAELDRGGLKKAGRALEKHGSRPGSVFPQTTGNVGNKNTQGQAVLDALLRSKQQSIKPNSYGGRDVFDLDTLRGVRFDVNGNMIGFLEP